MTSRARLTFVAVMTAATLVLSACGGAESGTGPGGPEGDPVSGGVAKVIESGEPLTLDPALLQNNWARMAVVGNALYGTLLVDDRESGGLELKMLEQFDSADGGKTFTLKVKEGLVFSDGSPFTAEAVKFGWDRMRDPATGSSGISQASLVKKIDVVDDLTAKVTLVSPAPNFPSIVTTTSMNWIGKPEVLEQGAKAIDANPVGAGPFVLDRWDRGSVVALKKNPKFWDAPRPYLDKLEVRAVSDPAQRFNAVASSQADLAVESEYENVAKAEQSGLVAEELPLDGGVGFAFNSSKPPFDDVRARNAISYALDLGAIDLASRGGKGEVPETFFREESPFYSDVPLHAHDPEKAQALFDELAEEGKPLEFSFSYFPNNQPEFEAMQAQLSQFDNVTMKADPTDQAEAGVITQKGDFQMLVSSVLFGVEPDPRVWIYLHSKSPSGNFTRISDPELDAALDAARDETELAARVEAYEKVQEKLAELTPYILFIRSGSAVIQSQSVGGLEWYGLGALLPEYLWLAA